MRFLISAISIAVLVVACGGGGGSGGVCGGSATNVSFPPTGGLYGGGGGRTIAESVYACCFWNVSTKRFGPGSKGAYRVLWPGCSRSFPSTCVASP